ncbi:glycosyltransferase [Pedobacter agri]|uniref:glycosyltransferase n=1 Tax=Pedobacter agri TaxID=454586 RepID=UPI00292E9EBD|nr:glycosyltransferase [Pedobacter agri]
MKNIAFTICAKNYIGLAQVLEKSIHKHNPDIDFFILVADEITPEDKLTSLASNVLIAKDVIGFSADKWNDMSFKYDLTEFCTSIKPACFKFLINSYRPENCIYFDPDILVFDKLDSIFNSLNKYSIIVTPHITTIQEEYTGSLQENGLLFTGMFNLGFLACKCNEVTNRMLNWWDERLKDRCFINRMENYFTDQKWMDFLPSFFPKELLISHDLGLNFAPWNFYEREVIDQEGKFYVVNRLQNGVEEETRLKFVHFSGFNYKGLLSNEVSQGNIPGLAIYPDVVKVIDEYGMWLKSSSFTDFSNLSYTYNTFSNGTPISKTYRKLYRRLSEDGVLTENPFNQNGVFYQSLQKGKLLSKSLVHSDRQGVSNLEGVDRKLIKVNKLFSFAYKVLGAERFFMLVRLLRIYSKIENHVYLIDPSYLKEAKIRD